MKFYLIQWIDEGDNGHTKAFTNKAKMEKFIREELNDVRQVFEHDEVNFTLDSKGIINAVDWVSQTQFQ